MDKVQQWRAVDEGSNSYSFECLPSVHCLILGGSPPADRQTHTQCFPASWMILPGMDFLLPLCTRDCPCIIKYLFWERKELLYYNIKAQQAESEQLYWQLNAINNCTVSLRPWFSPSWINQFFWHLSCPLQSLRPAVPRGGRWSCTRKQNWRNGHHTWMEMGWWNASLSTQT